MILAGKNTVLTEGQINTIRNECLFEEGHAMNEKYIQLDISELSKLCGYYDDRDPEEDEMILYELCNHPQSLSGKCTITGCPIATCIDESGESEDMIVNEEFINAARKQNE